MSVPEITYVPKEVRLDLYAGDGCAMQLTLTDVNNDPIPLDGDVSAQIRKFRSDDEPIVEFLAAVTDNVVLLTLTGGQTDGIGEFQGAWDVQWTPPGSQPITLIQGKCRCSLDVTRV